MQLGSSTVFAAWLVAAALAVTPARAEDASPSAPPSDATAGKPGGIQFPMQQSPAMRAVPIGYIREIVDHPRPASRVDVEPDDAGIAGAKLAIDENNAGGKLVGDLYTLDTQKVISPADALKALQTFYDSGHHFIVVDASADTLLKLSDWAKDKDILLFNVRDTDVSLRQENCRVNVMHTAPDRYMLADALVSAGVVVAGALTLGYGWSWIDPVASLLIAAVIVVGTWSLLRQSLHLMVDGVPAHLNLVEVRECLQGLPGVGAVHDLHVWAMGTSEVALTAHLVMPGAPADDAFLNAAAQTLRERFGIAHVTLQTSRTPVMTACV